MNRTTVVTVVIMLLVVCGFCTLLPRQDNPHQELKTAGSAVQKNSAEVVADGTNVFYREGRQPAVIGVMRLVDPVAAVAALEKKIGLRVVAVEAFAVRPPSPMHNCFNGLQFLAEQVATLSSTVAHALGEGTHAVTMMALEFMPDMVRKLGKMPVEVSFVRMREDAPDISYANYTLYWDAQTKAFHEVLVWYDTTLAVSSDFFAVLWAHELTHLITMRMLMQQRNLQAMDLVVQFQTDESLRYALEDKAWRVTVEVYDLLMDNGVFQRNLERPPMDIKLWSELADAKSALMTGGETWRQFVVQHTHKVAFSK